MIYKYLKSQYLLLNSWYLVVKFQIEFDFQPIK